MFLAHYLYICRKKDMKLKLKYYPYKAVIMFPALLISTHDICLGWLKWGIVLSWGGNEKK